MCSGVTRDHERDAKDESSLTSTFDRGAYEIIVNKMEKSRLLIFEGS